MTPRRGPGGVASPGGPRARRVLFLVDAYWHPHGGTEGQLAVLVRRLPVRWQPTVWVVHDSPWLRGHAFPCPTRSFRVRSLRRLRYVPAALSLLRAVAAERFDLVVALMGDAGVVGPLAGRLAGTPVLVSRRDLGFWRTPAIDVASRRAARLTHGFLANCDAVARHVVEADGVPPSRVRVVRNGHEPAAFDVPADDSLRERLSIPAGAPIVGCLANVKPLKRQADLLEAAGRLSAKVPDLHVLLLGAGPWEELRAVADRAGVGARLRTLHATGPVVPILKNLAVGALCSETEGLSNAILEYMGSGLPVVATDVGGNPELVRDGENGCLYPVGDVEALAAALSRVLCDPATAAEMGRASRRRFEAEFGAERMVRESVDAFDAAGTAREAGSGPDASSSLRVSVETDLSRLEALAGAWRDLTGPLGFFVGPDWCLAWWREAAEGATPHALAVRDAAGALVGVLPLTRRGDVLETTGTSDGADHVDVAANAGRAEEVARAAVRALAETPWRRLDLRHLAEGGALRAALWDVRAALPTTESLATTCPFLTTAGGFEAFAARFSAKRRGNLRRQARAFLAAPGSRLERVTDPAAAPAAVDALLDLHAERFTAAGRATSFSGERVRRFHRALAASLAARGALSLVVLNRGEVPVAAHYGFVHGGRLSHFQGGFDPALAEESPGTALLWTVLEEDVFGAGLVEYDFLDGGEAYKRSFASGHRALYDVTAFRPTRWGRARARIAGAVALAKDAARRRLRPGPEAE